MISHNLHFFQYYIIIKAKNEASQLKLALTVKATILGSIPISSDTVESEGRQMKQC
jgi:hypothetical protein